VTSATGAPLLTSVSFAVNGLRAGIQFASAQNCAGCLNADASALDYFFDPNAGVSGNLGGMVRTGDARTILNSDDDPTNDNGGPAGALLNEIVLQPAPLILPAGSYVTTLSGTFNRKTFTANNTIEVLNPGSCR
jgi:hypothetical protein